ncbi:hypothetical protein HPG69_012625 [Diceros bicornis minor]|uniref:Uncharacterized protein n=1 Tax=Diceros bicornis minor TaxID=77932 RepID=A0A7J7F0Y3_DICBM|nr:hypothetical protein HPG69_012625 [Diceros bicornis minor]
MEINLPLQEEKQHRIPRGEKVIKALVKVLKAVGVLRVSISQDYSTECPAKKANGIWRLTVGYCQLNSAIAHVAMAVPDLVLRCTITVLHLGKSDFPATCHQSSKPFMVKETQQSTEGHDIQWAFHAPSYAQAAGIIKRFEVNSAAFIKHLPVPVFNTSSTLCSDCIHFNLSLRWGKRTFVDPSKLRLPSLAHRILSPFLSNATSGTVLVGCSSDRPLHFLSRGPSRRSHRLFSPLPPSSLLPHHFPAGLAANRLPLAVVTLVAAIFATYIKQRDRFPGSGTDWCLSSAMSDIEKGSPAPSGQNGASGRVSQDPGSTRSVEWGAQVARAADPRDCQAVVQAPLEEEGGQEVPQPIVEEDWDVQQLEEEEDLYSLEKKYDFYQPLLDKRSEIISAIHEPTEGECQWEGGVQEGARYVFRQLVVPKSQSFFAQEAAEYQYENIDEEAQEAGAKTKEATKSWNLVTICPLASRHP